MLKKTTILSILLSAVIFTLGATNIFADNQGKVTTTKLNVRSGPSTKYEVIGSLNKNEEITILKSSNGWHQVKLSNNQQGWSSGKYIKTNQRSVSNQSTESIQSSEFSSNTTTKKTMNKKGIVTISSLNVRSGPSVNYSKISSVRGNTTVNVTASSKGWYKIQLSNNQQGWVNGSYIKITNNSNDNSGDDSDKITMQVEATAYTGYNITSTGEKPVWGTIAVDPKVIPYGTRVYIPYFDKVFVANNCGGAIKGNKIDIFMDTKAQCYEWGRRNIEIQILGK